MSSICIPMRMNLIKAPGERGSGPFSFERLATFPPQADHVLVVFFFGRGGTWGAALKPPRHLAPEQGPEDFQDLHGPEALSQYRHGFIHGGLGDCVKAPRRIRLSADFSKETLQAKLLYKCF